MKPNRIVVGSLLSSAAALAFVAAPPAFADDVVKARATINSCTDGSFVGTAFLVERPSAEGVKQVDVFLTVQQGLTAGKHAVHIHETGACTPTCAAAGGHFDPGPFGNSSPAEANHPFHSGDLINLNVSSTGRGASFTTTSRVTLSPGVLSTFDANGSAIVIHVAADTYCPNGNVAGCAGGGRAACGVLELVTDN